MKKSAILLSACVAMYAQSAELEKVTIEEKINAVNVKNLGSEELKSADLAEALNKNAPSIWLVRRSGIANDIILRGQKRDNINVIIDGSKICGACPNRMDPPTSHIPTHIVEDVEIVEGPFDVENFGTLSGLVNITTKEPESGFGGELNLNAGSWNYKKGSLTLHGGNETIKGLVTIAKESGDQYKDGNGDDFAQQLINYTSGTTFAGNQLLPQYEDMKAYEKTTLLAKIFWHINDNQDLKLSYTANRSDDILYPSSPMDAIWDDSDIYNLHYQIRDLATYAKKIDVEVYNSQVDHPMSIRYRKKSAAETTMFADMTNHLTTDMTGMKVKDTFDIANTEVIVGIDSSIRKWDGQYFKSVSGDYITFPPTSPYAGEIKYSINDAKTQNNALFVRTSTTLGNIDLDFGARYDDTEIKNGGSAQDNDYSALNANVFATMHAGADLTYFAGVGKSSRVPDPRELYFQASGAMNPDAYVGTPNLDQVTNYEVDLGFEKIYERFSIKTKLFYSMLKDYIYINATKTSNIFENIDATIYGAEISGAYLASESLYVDYGMAYKKGQKDDPLEGQSDKDLAEINPLKANIGVGYDYDSSLGAKLDMIAVSDWTAYDADNGEQKLGGFAVINVKVNKSFDNGLGLTLGVDNLLDKTYATANTYRDLTLVAASADVAVDEVMLLNDPGRYFYINASYKF